MSRVVGLNVAAPVENKLRPEYVVYFTGADIDAASRLVTFDVPNSETIRRLIRYDFQRAGAELERSEWAIQVQTRPYTIRIADTVPLESWNKYTLKILYEVV